MDILILVNRLAGLILGVMIIVSCLRIISELRSRELAVSMLFLKRRESRIIAASIFIASIFTVLVGLTFVRGQSEFVVEGLMNLNALFLLVAVGLLASVMGGDA